MLLCDLVRSMVGSSVPRIIFFFFSSRRRHTRFDCDWSSDVCSSDLPRSVECVPVTPGANVRLVSATLGMEELAGSAALTAMSASPPPGARPRFSGVPTLLAHPPFVKLKMPQLSGWPSYLNGSVRLLLGGPSSGLDQRHRSTPPGTPRIETT